MVRIREQTGSVYEMFRTIRNGRVRWPMPVLLGYYLVMHATLTPLASSPGFQRFSNWFGMAGRVVD